MTIKRLIGSDPNQISLNRDLGSAAFNDAGNFAQTTSTGSVDVTTTAPVNYSRGVAGWQQQGNDGYDFGCTSFVLGRGSSDSNTLGTVIFQLSGLNNETFSIFLTMYGSIYVGAGGAFANACKIDNMIVWGNGSNGATANWMQTANIYVTGTQPSYMTVSADDGGFNDGLHVRLKFTSSQNYWNSLVEARFVGSPINYRAKVTFV
jgi:hypothetical protein